MELLSGRDTVASIFVANLLSKGCLCRGFCQVLLKEAFLLTCYFRPKDRGRGSSQSKEGWEPEATARKQVLRSREMNMGCGIAGPGFKSQLCCLPAV